MLPFYALLAIVETSYRGNDLFRVLLISVLVRCYYPSCNKCCNLEIILVSVTASILPLGWKQITFYRREFTLSQSTWVRHEILRHADLFFDDSHVYFIYRQHLLHLLNFFSTPLQQTFFVFTFFF